MSLGRVGISPYVNEFNCSSAPSCVRRIPLEFLISSRLVSEVQKREENRGAAAETGRPGLWPAPGAGEFAFARGQRSGGGWTLLVWELMETYEQMGASCGWVSTRE